MSNHKQVISHWYTLLENFEASPLQFYTALGAAIQRRKIPDIQITSVSWHEGSLFSVRREYLRISRKDLYFDVCGAPFGTSFFISWWLLERPTNWLIELLGYLPHIGPVVKMLLKPISYYQIDTALMFQSVTHSAVLEVIDAATASQGIRGLLEAERKPLLREFSGR